MSLLQIPLADLTPYANNSRTHSDAQVAQIANSIKAFGFTNPLLIDEHGGIIAGHGRLRAAASLGMETVPCLTLAGLTADEKNAYVIADNQLALNAGWDMSRLKSEVQALLDTDFDVDLIGFDTRFLDDLLAEPLPPLVTDPDAVPDTPQTPISVEGDVWILGHHRAMCGDSTSVDAVERLMHGERAALLHADPPYGMGKQKDGVQMYSHWFSKSQWAFISEQYYAQLQAALPGRFLAPYSGLRRIYEEVKAEYRQYLSTMRAYFDNTHSVMRDVWEFPRVVGDERHGHATPKPVEMMERVMRSSVPAGGLCVEPFSGSGSTLLAAERTGRRCYTMELTPVYVDVTVRRWQRVTGQRAVHAETGAFFDDG